MTSVLCKILLEVIKMKEEKVYFFPQNYNKKEKFLGVFDYRAIFIIGILGSCAFYLLKAIEINIKIKVCIFLIFTLFPAIFMFVGINGENMMDIMKYAIKFFIKERVYVYRKTEDKNEKIYKKLVPYKKYK